jgi:ribosomal protein S18 acetylase RimI-like enzyme
MPRRELDLRLPPSWDTAAAALAACARALGDRRNPGAIAAASGLAFRVSVDERVSPAGPHAYPWRETLTTAAERLGCEWRMVASAAGEPLFAEARERLYALAVAGVDAGLPTLLFGVHTAEFGLVRGYDPEAGALIVSGCLDHAGAPELLPRTSLGGEAGLLFALQLVGRVPVDEAAAARAALRAAVEHGRGQAPTIGGALSGLAAWRAVAAALESNRVDPAGLAYAAQRYAEARQAGSRFIVDSRRFLAADDAAAAEAASAARRAAGMLAELARLLPFPPPPTEMLTTTRREQAIELVREAGRADEQAIAALERALDAADRAALGRDLEVRDLDGDGLRRLFRCVEEIPIAGLAEEAASCRDRLAPTVGDEVRGKLLFRRDGDGERLIGHILYAPLEAARYPVRAAGRRWFVFCPWLERAARGRGLGRRLWAAVEEAARAEGPGGVDGLLTVATSIEVFLHHAGYEHFGFVEVDRRGDSRLLERRLTELPSEARFVDPPAPCTGGQLPVVVRHAYNCPLLLHVRRGAARAARAFEPRVAVDEADATAQEPAGLSIAGRPVAHGPVPPEAIAEGLADELGAPRT